MEPPHSNTNSLHQVMLMRVKSLCLMVQKLPRQHSNLEVKQVKLPGQTSLQILIMGARETRMGIFPVMFQDHFLADIGII